MKEIKLGKFIAIWLAVQIISVMVIILIFGKDVDNNIASLLLSTSTLIVLLKVGKVNRVLVKERIKDFKNKFNLKEVMGIVGTQILLSIALSVIISTVMYMFNPEYAIEMMKDEPMATDTTFRLLTATISASIMAPLLEELIFRRILFNRFSRKIGILGGAILSSVFFGLLHIELAMIGAMVFGITTCIVYRKYNNILMPMSIHFVNNLIASVGIICFTIIDKIFGPSEPMDYTMTASDIRYSIIFGGVALVIAMIIFGRFVYKNRIYLSKDKEIKALSI